MFAYLYIQTLNVMVEETGFEKCVDIGKVLSVEAPPGIRVLIKATGEFSLNQQARNSGWHTEDTPGRRMSVSPDDP